MDFKVKDIGDISRRSKFIFANTMVCLIKGLEGKHINVEIRNDYVVQGKLMSVDSAMGLTLARVHLTNVKGQTTKLDQFYIQGRMIRNVIIPDDVDIIRTMNWELNKVDIYKDFERGKQRAIFERKMQRKQVNHRQTVRGKRPQEQQRKQ